MTFNEYEISLDAGDPVELYTFAVGTETFRYTSTDEAITTGGNTYEPIPIAGGPVVMRSEAILEPIEITVPATNEFALKYLTVPPGQLSTVTIDRMHRDDPDEELQRIFAGSVHSVRFSEDFSEAVLGAFWTTANHNRQIPRFTFGSPCNYVLGDSSTCKVNLESPSFKHTGQVAAAVGRILTVSGITGSFPDGFFTGGVVRTVTFNDRRLVVKHVGDELTLIVAFHDDIVGTLADVRAGCDHRIEGDCATKYDNVIEYGGWPFSPNQNPFISGID